MVNKDNKKMALNMEEKIMYPLNLQLFNDGNGEGGSAGDEGNAGDNASGDNGQGQSKTGDAGQGEGDEKTFTQAEIDAPKQESTT